MGAVCNLAINKKLSSKIITHALQTFIEFDLTELTKMTKSTEFSELNNLTDKENKNQYGNYGQLTETVFA